MPANPIAAAEAHSAPEGGAFDSITGREAVAFDRVNFIGFADWT